MRWKPATGATATAGCCRATSPPASNAGSNGALVFGADLYPAIAANPYIAFPLRATQAGELVFLWTGDNGFRHQETRRLDLA